MKRQQMFKVESYSALTDSRKIILVLLVFIVSSSLVSAQKTVTGSCTGTGYFVKEQIFDPIKDNMGYHNYRIPSFLVTSKGTYLAVVEGRSKSIDHAENDIVLKRSKDNGANWEKEKVLVQDGNACCMNPTIVETESGKIILVYVRFPEKYHTRIFKDDGIEMCEPGFEGEKIERVFIIESNDEGLTWSSPREITHIAKKSSSTIASISGPGTGIVLTLGSYKGRIIIPMYDVRFEDTENGRARIFTLYSDDDGVSWQSGEFVPKGKEEGFGGECQVVELEKGKIMINARASPKIGYRKVAISEDGGITWSSLVNEIQLIDTGCMGSILRYSWATKNSPGILIYSGATARVEGTKRGAGTIWISYDDGKTWPIKKLFYPGKFDYSSLARLPDGTIGMLAEFDFDGERLNVCLAKFNLGFISEVGP
jgi:sialidase-1